MARSLPPQGCTRPSPRRMPRRCNTVAALIIAVVVVWSAREISYVVSTVRPTHTSDLLGYWNLGTSRKILQHERWDNEDFATLLAESSGESSAEVDGEERRTEDLPTDSRRQEWVWWDNRRYREDDQTRSSVSALLKHYSSFAKYALENDGSNATLPLPVVAPVGYRTLLSIPIVTIIGVQKGGTTNLRRNLLTHPLVSGMRNEVHFFDRSPDTYPKLGRWPGDNQESKLNPGIAGYLLTKYASACLEEGRGRKRSGGMPLLGKGVIVESCPRYMLSPLAPYRMRMVRPQARLVVVLRDPTERYFSQLRMLMCKKEPDPGFKTLEEMIQSFFHPPGWAKEYIARAEAFYQPYTPLCRGENATAADLWACDQRMKKHGPLHRGLYADQLERWFRVYDRSQIMIVASTEMFADFIGTVKTVAKFAGLPDHDFEYDPHEFSGACDKRSRRGGHNYFFAEGGPYQRMLEDEDHFREFYRPHNERLFGLLGRDLGWNT